MAITTMSVATPEKMAPATKNAPNIVLFHGSRSVIAKIQETTVWTETAMGMISIIAVVIAAAMDRHWDGVPCQRTESRL
jgi:poly(3-hydroxybutyrate) depolymerase